MILECIIRSIFLNFKKVQEETIWVLKEKAQNKFFNNSK